MDKCLRELDALLAECASPTIGTAAAVASTSTSTLASTSTTSVSTASSASIASPLTPLTSTSSIPSLRSPPLSPPLPPPALSSIVRDNNKRCRSSNVERRPTKQIFVAGVDLTPYVTPPTWKESNIPMVRFLREENRVEKLTVGLVGGAAEKTKVEVVWRKREVLPYARDGEEESKPVGEGDGTERSDLSSA